ncbi:acyltransferase family protein [Aestuariibius insulae]|uniref:acyltransferase family protein n=1 Tax=Aestuariibius insulae TaxID=2058287 RepID=UPI00345E70F2
MRQGDSSFRYIPELDGLRYLAALSIFFFHGATDRILPSGSLGVDVFLVLSGFLTVSVALAAQGSFSPVTFVARRLVRIYPALFVVTIACLPRHLYGDFDVILIAATVLTFTSNFALMEGANLGSLIITWSLAVEMHFYLVISLFLWLALVRGGSGRSRSDRILRLQKIALAAFLLTTALRIASGLFRDAYFEDYFNSLFRMSGLFLGAWLATIRWRPSPLLANISTALAIAIIFSLMLLPYKSGVDLLEISIVELCSVALILSLATRTGLIAALLRHPIMRMLGSWSYSFYLCHLLVLHLIVNQIPTYTGLALAFVVSHVFAAACYRYIERPSAQAFRRYLPDHKTQVSPASTP